MGNRLRAVAQAGLGALLAGAGIGHLTALREEFQAQVPTWVPLDADTVVLASGVVEIGLGAGHDHDVGPAPRLTRFQPQIESDGRHPIHQHLGVARVEIGRTNADLAIPSGQVAAARRGGDLVDKSLNLLLQRSRAHHDIIDLGGAARRRILRDLGRCGVRGLRGS